MTGSGQGKTQAGELLIQKSQLNFHGLCTLPILEAKCSQKILFRKWIELWLLFSCVIFNKYHTFMGWVADRSNESNLDLSNLRSKYLRSWQAVAVELWLFLWLWVKRPPGNSMLGPPHYHLVHTYTDWGKGQSWGQTIFRGKVSCCNIISSYYALGHIWKNVGQKLCQRFYAHICRLLVNNPGRFNHHYFWRMKTFHVWVDCLSGAIGVMTDPRSSKGVGGMQPGKVNTHIWLFELYTQEGGRKTLPFVS